MSALIFSSAKVVSHLKKIVEGEGFVFKVHESAFGIDARFPVCKTEVVFFGRDELELIEFAPKLMPTEIGALFKVFDNANADTWYTVNCSVAEMTKQRVAVWLNGENWDCIVCFADENDIAENGGAKTVLCPCRCGAIMCFGCVVDQIIVGIDDADIGEMEYRCPNCRQTQRTAMGNLMFFYSVLLESPSLFGLSDTQRAFLQKYTGFDGSKQALRVIRKRQKRYNKRRHQLAAELILTETCYEDFSLKHETIAFSEAKCELGIVSDASNAALMKARHGCGNCGKEFWDARAKKRAPKCAKCMRVSYCNAKCRKAHKKTHAPMCKKTGKRKAAKKPKPARTGKKQSASATYSCCKTY